MLAIDPATGRRAYDTRDDAWLSEDGVLHFVGRKPWETLFSEDARFEELELRWLDFVTARQLREIARAWYRARVPHAVEAIVRKLDKLRRDPVQFLLDTRMARPFRRGAR